MVANTIDDFSAGPMLCDSTRIGEEEARRTGLHTFPIEHNGMSMQDLVSAMKEDAEMQKHLVACCEELVGETVKYNDAHKKPCDVLASFEGEVAPIEPASYVRRILKYGNCSPCCIVIGILYLERLKKIFPTVALSSSNFQRLLLVACMTAAKFLDDSYYSNKRWAEVGGIGTKELNRLELEFLFRIGFSLSVTREEYDWYVRTVIDPEEETESDEEADVETSKFKGLVKSISFQDVTDAAAFFMAH